MKYTADFETTTDVEDCRVWAYGLCNIDSLEFKYGNNITDLIKLFETGNNTLYFHNLKFDGDFILVWLFENGFTWVKEKQDLSDKTFTTLITDKRTVFFN